MSTTPPSDGLRVSPAVDAETGSSSSGTLADAQVATADLPDGATATAAMSTAVPAQLDVGTETTADENDKNPSKAPQPRICAVCSEGAGKYKCSRCSILYCSVACSRVHRENHPAEAPKPAPLPHPPPPTTTSTHRPSDDPYSILMEHADDFKRLFRKYPTLEDRLADIQAETLPPKGNALLSALTATPSESYARKGAAALRRARTDPGEDGDAVREYCELVIHLLARHKQRDLTQLMRQEVQSGDTKLIQHLLDQDKKKEPF